jgi:hypothetical protein
MEMLQRIRNPNKPSMTLKQIQNIHAAIANTSNDNDEKVIKHGLLKMDNMFQLS